jgi:hypothetical protein
VHHHGIRKLGLHPGTQAILFFFTSSWNAQQARRFVENKEGIVLVKQIEAHGLRI